MAQQPKLDKQEYDDLEAIMAEGEAEDQFLSDLGMRSDGSPHQPSDILDDGSHWDPSSYGAAPRS